MERNRQNQGAPRNTPDRRLVTGFPVEVKTLGNFAVYVDGESVNGGAKGPRKPFALLKTLIALGGQGIASELLIDSLWADLDGDHAQSAFRTTLHRLRSLLGHDAILLSSGRLTINPERCWVDAEVLKVCLEEADQARLNDNKVGALKALEDALALYEGPFLEGDFDPPEILTNRERLHGGFLHQLGATAQWLALQDRNEEALELYRRGLERDELAEAFYLGQMHCFRRQGSYAKALGVFSRMREVFESRMGAAVSPEAEALRLDIFAELNRKEPQAPSEKLIVNPLQLPVDPSQVKGPRRSYRRMALATLIVVALSALLAGGIGIYQQWRTNLAVEEFRQTAKLPLPDEPSLAVLPFTNLSGDPEQDVIADAFGEAIATDLASVINLFVISYGTTEKFKGKVVDVPRMARELGVRYVLKGSLQREGNNLRVTVELMDASIGRQVWAERYDRTLGDLFVIQDDISRRIATEMEVNLTEGVEARCASQAAKGPEAYILLAQARQHHRRFRREENQLAHKLLKQALALDPDYLCALSWLGWSHWLDARYGWSESREASLQEAERLARLVVAKHPDPKHRQSLLTYVYLMRRQIQPAIENMREVVSNYPGHASSTAQMGLLLVYNGQPEQGIPYIRRAMRLSPYYPVWFLGSLGEAFRLTGRLEEAESAFRNVLVRQPDDIVVGRVRLVAVLAEQGRLDEARSEAAHLLKINPRFTVTRYGASRLYTDKSVTRKLMDNLRLASLPD